MRRLVILLAAALAGCSVELEGAACDVPGTTDQCPSGQTCGIDGKCSSKPRLECDPAGPELAVDEERSGTMGNVTVTPTGAASPAGCRLPSLAAAVAAVRATTTGIKIYKGSTPAVFDLTETLIIPAGFTLSSDGAASDVVLRATAGMDSVVSLTPGATLRYVTVESSTDQSGDALTVACGNLAAKVTLTGVTVNGANKVRRGLTVTGKCGVDATDLVVTGAKEDGVHIDADASANVTSTITRGELASNAGSGLVILAGRVVVQGDLTAKLTVHDNAKHGVFLSSRGPATIPSDLTVRLVDVHDNAEIGVFIMDAKRNSNTSVVVLDQVAIYKNKASSDLSKYGTRYAGGMLLQGALAPTFSMKGSTVCGNGKDEVGVYSDATWDLSAEACGTNSNRYFVPGVAGTDYFVFSTAATENVLGQNNFWVANPPSSYLQGVTYSACPSPPTAPSFCN